MGGWDLALKPVQLRLSGWGERGIREREDLCQFLFLGKQNSTRKLGKVRICSLAYVCRPRALGLDHNLEQDRWPACPPRATAVSFMRAISPLCAILQCINIDNHAAVVKHPFQTCSRPGNPNTNLLFSTYVIRRRCLPILRWWTDYEDLTLTQ